MGTLAAALASSHAFTFRDPAEWDDFRARISQGYKRRYGNDPADHPGIARESPEENRVRYARIESALGELRRRIADDPPDALVLIGDDQNENFKPDHLIPQLAVHVGDSFAISGRIRRGRTYRSHPVLSREILERGVGEGFDLAVCSAFSGGVLSSHAHYEILENVLGDLDVPVVNIFVNALHVPAIEPARCYAFGQMLGRVIAARPADERVMIYASGGLSHFTGGFPWRSYTGSFAFGAISEEFDRRCLDHMRNGEGHRLGELTSADLLHHGDIELRSWIALLGAVGDRRAQLAVYEPFYRGMMGMAAAAW
jgi:hypothetical protein